MSARSDRSALALAALAGAMLLGAAVSACGKKGPPLPPLLRIPAAPADFTAHRRGRIVDLQFTVPAANTDGSRPADLERVEVYGFTGSPSATDDELLKFGRKIVSLPVKPPPDEDAPDGQPAGPGLAQGAAAGVQEELTPETAAPAATDRGTAARSGSAAIARPLVPPPPVAASRTYVGVGINTHGRKGPLSKRALVPLGPAPPAPAAPVVHYDARTITVSWSPATVEAAIQAPASGSLLPARPVGLRAPDILYNVYDAPVGRAARGAPLTAEPLAAPEYHDSRVEWGATRCYAVRTVEAVGGLSLESEASPATCVTLADTFPPAPPSGLTAVASAGSINLIWQPSPDADVAGYLVLRGIAPGAPTERLTPAPIRATTYEDAVVPGRRYVYAVEAADQAGNLSAPSNQVEETAR